MAMICLNICPHCGQYMYEHRGQAVCPRCGVHCEGDEVICYVEEVIDGGLQMTIFPNQLSGEPPRAQA